MMPIVFPARVFKLSFDEHGEATLVLKAPKSELGPAARTLTTLEQAIKVTIEQGDMP